MGEVPAEGEVSDGDVVQDDPELICPADEICLDLSAEVLSLSDQLSSIELSHHGLQDLVGDAGQNSFIVVLTQRGVNVGKFSWLRSTTNFQLQLFLASPLTDGAMEKCKKFSLKGFSL